jgi:hypothetical protein
MSIQEQYTLVKQQLIWVTVPNMVVGEFEKFGSARYPTLGAYYAAAVNNISFIKSCSSCPL